MNGGQGGPPRGEGQGRWERGSGPRETRVEDRGLRQNGVKKGGSWEEGGAGAPLSTRRGWVTPEGEGLKPGEGIVSLPVTPSVFPIFTSQTPRFSLVATATAPARRGHQGNPVPASPPSPSLACPPQAAAVWRVGGATGGEKDPDSCPRKGGPRPTPGEHPHPKPTSSTTAGCAVTAGHTPQPSLGNSGPPTQNSRPKDPHPTVFPSSFGFHQAPPTVLCGPPIPEEA